MLKKYIFLHNFLNLGPVWAIRNTEFKKNTTYQKASFITTYKSNDFQSNNECHIKDNQLLSNDGANYNNNHIDNEYFFLKKNIDNDLFININMRTIYQITKKFNGENLLWVTLSPKIANAQEAINNTNYNYLLDNIIQSISIKSTTWKILNTGNTGNIFIKNLNFLLKNHSISTIILLSQDILQVMDIDIKNPTLKVITLPHPSLLIINSKIKHKVWEKLYY